MRGRSKHVSVVMKQLDTWVRAGVKKIGGRRSGGAIQELHMELTHRCDLKCVMCHHWEMPFKDKGATAREMTPGDIKKFISESKLLNDVKFIAVTGGEPWTRPDAVDIVAILRERFPQASLGILTNFWNTGLLRRKLAELKKRGVEKFWLGTSLDGIGEMHDRIRGQAGAFSGFLRTLQMLREEYPHVGLSLNFTIMPENGGQLWDAYRFAQEHKMGFGAQFVVNHQGYQAPRSFAWSKKELARVESQIERIIEHLARSNQALVRLVAQPPSQSRGLWNQMLFWGYLRRHGRGSPRFFDDCMAGERYAMLDPEGNLFFCPVNKHKQVGNVREVGFDAAWMSRKAEALRAEIIPCQCRCWLNCIANPILDRVTAAALSGAS